MFDIRQAATPFAMRPGLERLPPDARHFHALAAGSKLAQEKRAAWQRPSALLISPGFDAQAMALTQRAIRDQAQRDAINSVALHVDKTMGEAVEVIKNASETASNAFFQAISLAVEEDIAILDARAESPHRGGLPLLCVTCPSHWAPEEKIGKPLAEVHGPVADGALLLKATEGLIALVTRGERWQRWVWTITPSPHFDAHPAHDANPERRRMWPDSSFAPLEYLNACHLRSERQTFFPVLDDSSQPSGLAVFTIQVQLAPLPQALPTPKHAHALHNSLASMSQAVLAYKGLAAARDPLLAALRCMQASPASFLESGA